MATGLAGTSPGHSGPGCSPQRGRTQPRAAASPPLAPSQTGDPRPALDQVLPGQPRRVHGTCSRQEGDPKAALSSNHPWTYETAEVPMSHRLCHCHGIVSATELMAPLCTLGASAVQPPGGCRAAALTGAVLAVPGSVRGADTAMQGQRVRGSHSVKRQGEADDPGPRGRPPRSTQDTQEHRAHAAQRPPRHLPVPIRRRQ